MFRSTLELITDVCPDVGAVHRDFSESLELVRSVANELDICLASTGTHPLADYNNRILSPSDRYATLLDRNQWLIKRMAVYGLHVHLGMRNGDECIRFNNFFLHFIPHLIALSASSPFWKGRDTGLAAARPTTYESHPTSGIPIPVADWSAFSKLYGQLVATGSIQSMKDIWWDIRPSPGYGTLELRICDAPATLLELESIVAFIHLLSHWFEDHQEAEGAAFIQPPTNWILRENKWRAIRYGLDASIIQNDQLQQSSIRQDIYAWLKRLSPYLTVYPYQAYLDCIKDLLEHGTSSERQRRRWAQTKDLEQVVRWNAREFENGAPIYER
jgi:carboxylate-amine ligase